jgi:hypothetical protein
MKLCYLENYQELGASLNIISQRTLLHGNELYAAAIRRHRPAARIQFVAPAAALSPTLVGT